MLNFPEKTRCNRRIPKQTFYEHLPMTQKLERAFIDGIANIRLMNIISPVSMNITANEGFKELGVMVINLKTYPLDEYVLEVVDKHLPFYCFLRHSQARQDCCRHFAIGGSTLFPYTGKNYAWKENTSEVKPCISWVSEFYSRQEKIRKYRGFFERWRYLVAGGFRYPAGSRS